MIVIDVGCATHGGSSSIVPLVEEFEPSLLVGLDPSTKEDTYYIGKTKVIERAEAVWVHGGFIGFLEAGLGGTVLPGHREQVACVDIALVVKDMYTFGEDLILKMDAEMAEYQLLPHLIATEADKLLAACIVEWHCPECRYGWFGNEDEDTCGHCDVHLPGHRTKLEEQMYCQMDSWNL